MNDLTGHYPLEPEKPEPNGNPRRLSFLLRMWCMDETGRPNWQASLEKLETGKRLGFANLEQLFIYLIDLSESQNDFQDGEN